MRMSVKLVTRCGCERWIEVDDSVLRDGFLLIPLDRDFPPVWDPCLKPEPTCVTREFRFVRWESHYRGPRHCVFEEVVK